MGNISDNIATWSTAIASNQPDGSDINTIIADLQAIQAGVRTYLASRAAITAASTVDLSAVAGLFALVSHSTGAVAISNLGSLSAGMWKIISFAVTGGTLTLVHSAALVLPGGVNIPLSTNDTILAESLGGGVWQVHFVQDGAPASLAGFAPINNPTFTGQVKIPDNNGVASLTPGLAVVSDAGAGIGSHADGTLRLYTSNIERMRVQGASVSIGAVIPAAQLHIKQRSNDQGGGLLIERADLARHFSVYMGSDDTVHIYNNNTGHSIAFDATGFMYDGAYIGATGSPGLPGLGASEHAPADIAITAGGVSSLGNPFSAPPKWITMYLVCVTGEYGYTAGQLISIGNQLDVATSQGCSVRVTPGGDITVLFGNSFSTFSAIQVTGSPVGGVVSLTNANWNFRLRAYY